jgi:integrase
MRGWLETYRPSFSHGFEETADGAIENHLIPFFGEMPLKRIAQHHILAYVEKMVSDKKSPKTAMTGLSIMRRVCQIYIEEGLLDQNPFARCGQLVAQVERRHATEVSRADAWTHQEAEALLELAYEHERWIHGPLLCGLHTGMRRGEILGLEWQDIGPKKIVIRRAWTKGRLKVPKSGKAREVPKSEALDACLNELRDEIRTRRAFQEIGPVFLSPSGGRIDESNFGRAYRRLMKHAVEANIRPLRFHDARHTFASWALDGGRSIKWVQERLGHASAELTLRTYSHLIPSENDELGFLDAPKTKDKLQEAV